MIKAEEEARYATIPEEERQPEVLSTMSDAFRTGSALLSLATEEERQPEVLFTMSDAFRTGSALLSLAADYLFRTPSRSSKVVVCVGLFLGLIVSCVHGTKE